MRHQRALGETAAGGHSMTLDARRPRTEREIVPIVARTSNSEDT
jgi:hypothetical protein